MVLKHQEKSGDWGGIQPAMLNSVLALSCRGYEITRWFAGASRPWSFLPWDGGRTWLQSCISPVWDTALALRALAAAG